MAKNKTTYTLEIDAELGSLERKLSSVKGLLSGVLGSDKAPKGLEKAFEKIEGIIDKVKTKVSEPISTKASFSSITKDVDSAQVALASLLKIINSIGSMPEADRLSFLPPDAQAQIEKVVSSLSDYASAMDAAATETEELIAARTKLAQAEERVATAQAKVDSKQASLDAAKAERTAVEQSIALIEERKRKLEELREEQQKIEDFYNTPNEDGTKKNRSKKYDGVSMRPQDIKRQIKELEEASAGDEVALEGFNEKLKQTKEDIRSYQTQLNTANRTLRESKTEYEALTGKIEDLQAAFETDKVRDQQAAFATLRREAEALGVGLDGISESYSEKDASELISRITALKTRGFDKIKTAIDGAKENLDEFGETCKEVKGEVEAGTEAFEEMSEAASQQKALEDKIKSFLGIQGAAQLMRAALRDAMQTITELDATMTEMAVVTDLGVGDYWDQLPQYTERANELGLAINDVYQADTLFYQQGLKTNEVVAISTETMKMARIAGIDTALATDRMTAALRGFNMELDETSAKKIADVYSQLAAITAADVKEISAAMTKTASIAHSAGMEFETTAAFLSQIIETTRESAETAGTAMKTVIARFQELKKAPDEIGEVDGEIVDANAIETALRSVGVSLRDSSGQFRELDDVFLELSSKWDGLDKNTQRYIATIAAGSRQQSRFIAMMSDYARTQELVSEANNSAGASAKQFEKTQDSLKSKIEKLKNAWHEFTMGIMESDLVKVGVEILTKFLEIINKATSAFNGLGGSITKIASILAIFKLGSKIFDKLKMPLMNFFAEVVRMSRTEGEKSGKAFKEGVQRGTQPEPTTPLSKDEELENYEPKSFKQKVGTFVKDKTGIGDISSGFSSIYGKDSYAEGGLRDSQAKLAKLKQEGGDRKARLKQLETAKTIRDARAKNLGENNPLTKEADNDVKNAKKSLLEYDKAQKKVFDESQKGWEQVSSGLAKMGETAMAAGVGISMLGGLLSSLGLEEVGEGVSKLGNYITVAGTAIVTLIPIVKAISGALVTGGVAAQAAWWWAIIIVAAIAAILVGIIAIVNAVKNASPEGKLKKAEEAAEKASEAADQATDSYENLKDSLEGLEDQYKTLEKLTKGTKEWNDAIEKINSSVLDLIEDYPELAQYATPKDGYLSIDVNSDEVQKVLEDAKISAILSKNISALANSTVTKAEAAVKKKNYGITGFKSDDISKSIAKGELIIANGTISAGTKSLGGLGYTQKQLDEFYEANQEVVDGLRIYGEDLLIAEESFNAAYSAMALSAQQIANTSHFTNKELAIASNLVGGEDLLEGYQVQLANIAGIDYKNDKGLSEEQKIERDQAIRKVYGSEAKAEDYTNEQIQAAIAQSKSMESAVSMVEMIPAMLINFGKANSESMTEMITNLLADPEGGELSIENYNKLASLSEEALKQIYADLGDIGKLVLGTEKEFLKSVAATRKIVDKQNSSMKASMNKIFGEGTQLPDWNLSPEIGSQLLSKFAEVFENADSNAFQTFYDGFNALLSKVSEEQQSILASIVESIDWGDTTSLNTLPDKLAQAGFSLQDLGDDLYDFIDSAVEASNAIAKLSNEELSKVTKNLSDLIRNISGGEQGRTISDDQYNSLLAMDPSLRSEFAKTSEGYMYLGNSMEDLREAVLENTGALRGEDQEAAAEAVSIFDAMEEISTTHQQYGQKAASYAATLQDIGAKEGQIVEEERKRATAQEEADEEGEITAWHEVEDYFIKTWRKYGIIGFDSSYEKSDAAQDRADNATRQKNIYIEEKNSLVEKAEGLKSYEDYGEYVAVTAENINKLSVAQMRDYLSQLYNSKENGEYKYKLNNLIDGLYNGFDFSLMEEDALRDTVRTLLAKSGNKTYYQELANTTPEVQIGKEISWATLGGVETLKEWYETTATNKEGYQSILKGSMIKLASEYGFYENQYRQYFDAAGNVITDKFDEFIAMLEDFEEHERKRPQKEIETNLLNQVKEALISAREEEIDKLADKFDAIAEANNRMVDAIQNWVDEERRRRQNEETKKDISDKYSQLAYLGMDTSGSGALEALALQKETEQLERDYQDSLIDQSIQQLQDANQRAEEQRNTQIEIARQQLEAYSTSIGLLQEAEGIVNDAISSLANGENIEDTQLGKLLAPKEPISSWEQEEFWGELTKQVGSLIETDKHNIDVSVTVPVNIENTTTTPTTSSTVVTDGGGGGCGGGRGGIGMSAVSIKAYDTGGLADFTGPAWLDGTPSKPEYVLNAAQTERFFSLVDILEGIDTKDGGKKSTGDNYFDIEINVEKLENDYDVEQVADKIRRMIYDDATYRNVNAINHIR